MLLHMSKGAVLVQAQGAGLDPVWDGFSAGQLWNEHLCLREDKEVTHNTSVLKAWPADMGDCSY